MSSEEYDELMARGDQLMRAGNAAQAERAFSLASADPMNSAEDASRAVHMRGVCERVLGEYALAETSMLAASLLTSDDATKSIIDRDRSAIALHLGLYGTAYRFAKASYGSLVRLAEAATDDSERVRLNDEAYASMSYLGEAECLLGNRQEGTAHLWEAYAALRFGDNDHYLLNATVRLLKYCPESRFRAGIASRALAIARHEGNSRRVAEITILVFGGRHVYGLIERTYYRASRH